MRAVVVVKRDCRGAVVRHCVARAQLAVPVSTSLPPASSTESSSFLGSAGSTAVCESGGLLVSGGFAAPSIGSVGPPAASASTQRGTDLFDAASSAQGSASARPSALAAGAACSLSTATQEELARQVPRFVYPPRKLGCGERRQVRAPALHPSTHVAVPIRRAGGRALRSRPVYSRVQQRFPHSISSSLLTTATSSDSASRISNCLSEMGRDPLTSLRNESGLVFPEVSSFGNVRRVPAPIAGPLNFQTTAPFDDSHFGPPAVTAIPRTQLSSSTVVAAPAHSLFAPAFATRGRSRKLTQPSRTPSGLLAVVGWPRSTVAAPGSDVFSVGAEVAVSSTNSEAVQSIRATPGELPSASIASSACQSVSAGSSSLVLRAQGSGSSNSRAAVAVQDASGARALKEAASQGESAIESRAVKHARIRPALKRGGSAILQSVYDRLLASRLDLARVPTQLRERIRRLQKQGVTVGTIFNIVSGEEETRLIDASGRLIVFHEEVESILTYMWEEGYKMDTTHSLRRKVTARFSGLGAKKVEQFLAQMISTSVRNFPIPYAHHPRHVLASRPMEHVQVDCTHLFPVTHLGDVVTGVISFIDLFSRYIFALPVRAECTWEVSRAFLLFCCIFGAPEILQSDHGTAFLGEMKKMAEDLFGCKVIHGRVRHPESQAKIEKSHGKLKNNIIGLSYEHFSDILRWPEMVPMAMRLANGAPHATFNEELSPFMVFFGRLDNQPLAVDASILNGLYIQKAARLQTIEEKKRARLAGRVDIDQFVAGNHRYDVDLSFAPFESPETPVEDRIFIEAGEQAQLLVDRQLSSCSSVNPTVRVGYTSAGILLLQESGTVVRQFLEMHRMCAESLLRRQSSSGQQQSNLGDALRDVFVGDSSIRDSLSLFANFSSSIRESAAQFSAAYIESIDAGTRKRMPAPYQQNEGVWVLTLSENPTLSKRYQGMWISQSDRRLKKRLPAVIRSVDASTVHRPYEVEIFIDGETAVADNRSICEVAWLSGASLAPQTTFARKVRQYGSLEQVPGLCIQRTSPTLYCLRRAAQTCQRSLCELHCAVAVNGTCGAHRSSAKELYAITTS